MEKIKVAVIGPGNIGTDLMFKILRSDVLEMGMMTGIVESEGIRRAASLGIPTSIEGVDAVVRDPDIKIVFDATSAPAHAKINGPKLREAGILSIDLTPAALGPYCVPSVNLDSLTHEPDINMVTCGGQATIPIVYAISQTVGVSYAEIVACISAKSAGPGTRANIDEFTETTSKALVSVGGADEGKAIIIINPAEPPLMMTNTIVTRIKHPEAGIEVITEAVENMVRELEKYVPGYQLSVPPTMDGDKVTTIVRIKGQGDFLPEYSGNLDIINAAAVTAAEKLAREIFRKEGDS